MEKIYLNPILNRVISDIKDKDYSEKTFSVIISSYQRHKDKFRFKLNGSEPLIRKIKDYEFHIYDDFYDYKGEPNKQDIMNHYNQYGHVMFTRGPLFRFRVDYKPVEKKDKE